VAARLTDPEIVKKLFDEIAPKYAERPGGYTTVANWVAEWAMLLPLRCCSCLRSDQVSSDCRV